MTVYINGTTGISGVDGSAGTPAVQGTDTNTGVFYPAADTVGVSTGGSERMRIDTSGNVGINGIPQVGVSTQTEKFQVLGTDGPTCAIASKRYSADATGTQLRGYKSRGASVGTDTAVQSGDGILSINAYGYTGSQYSIAANINFDADAAPSGTTLQGRIRFFTTDSGGSGTERMRIDSSGNVGIGTTTTTRAKLNIDTDGSNTSAGYGLALTNLAGGGATWTLQCGDYAVNNGAFTIRQTGISGTTYFKIEASTGYITVPGVYTLTTGSAANVFVGTGGDLRRSTSSLKYKTDIQNATHGLAEVMQLRPVIYKGINDGETVFGGFIAEEVDALGLTEFVQYADDGSPDALAYGNMVSLLAKAIQEQQALITALTARIEALEAK